MAIVLKQCGQVATTFNGSARVIEFSVSTVYPNALATSAAERRSNRYARNAS